MTTESKAAILRAFLAKEGLKVVPAEGAEFPEGFDPYAKLYEIAELARDIEMLEPVEEVEVQVEDAWDDAITLEFKVPDELIAKSREG